MSLEHALSAAAAGFRVVPIPGGSKGPRLADWPARATTNETTIRRWFAEHQAENYGLAMGGGLLAIDVDVKGSNGEQTLFALEADIGPLPDTRTHRTPSGGRHLIFRVPDGVSFANGVNVVPGVDLRSEGGQVVGPGSSTMHGKYVLEHDLPAADLPAAWLAHFAEVAPAGQPRNYAPAPSEAHELLYDGRKEWLRDRVWQLRRTGLGEGAIIAALDVEAPLRIADAALYSYEIRRLARNVVRRDPGAEEKATGLVGDELRQFRRLGMTDEEAVEDVRAERREAFPVIGLSTIMREPKPPLLVGEWLPQGALAVLYGKEYSGKSLVALDWALSVANGLSWLDDIPVAQGYVLYVLGEGRLQERAAAWMHGRWRGRGDDPLSGVGVHRSGFKVTDDAAVAGLVDHARDYAPALVVLDTLARVIGGDENASEVMGRVVDAAGAIHAASPLTTVLIVGHPSKANDGIRGHSSLAGAADVIIRAVGQPSEGAASAYAQGAATGGAITLSSEKNKDGGRVKSLDLCLRSDGHSVYLDYDHQGVRSRATVPPSRQGGRGRQQDGLGGWSPGGEH